MRAPATWAWPACDDNVIFFRNNTLDQLRWDLLLDTLGTPVSNDLLNSLKYASAKQLESHLATDGQPTAGAELGTLLGLSQDQIDNLQVMDPAAVKALMAQGRPIVEIAELDAQGRRPRPGRGRGRSAAAGC